MGIDIYMSWDQMTPLDKKRQFDEDYGYLRESYFASSYYATEILLRETWDREPNCVRPHDVDDHERDCFAVFYQPEVLESRLEQTLRTTCKRYGLSATEEEEQIELWKEGKPCAARVQAFVNFVQLFREKYDAGLRPRVYNSY